MKKIIHTAGILTALVCVVVIITGLGGCATSGAGTREKIEMDLGKVAVVPFENLSSEPNAGLIIMRNMDCAFRKGTSLDIIDMNIMRHRLDAVEGEYLAPVKMGEMLGVDSVITGAVTEYRYVYGAGEQPVVGLNIQIVSVATGEILWSEQATSTGNLSWIREESLAEVSEQITKSLAGDFQRVYMPAR